MKYNKNIKKNNGQIAIIVLLASAIVLTLGLSASKITTTEVKINTDEESLKNAFNSAESAINQYLSIGSTNYLSTTNNSGASIVATNIGGANSLTTGSQVPSGTAQLFWLVNHNSDGSIGNNYYPSSFTISAEDQNIALKIDYFYIESGVYKVSRFGCYKSSNSNIVGFNFDCSQTINTSSKNSLLAVVTPLNGPTKITISGSSSFPIQGEDITSNSSTQDGIKTQIKTKYIYEFPTFMLDAITAKGSVE